MNALDYILVVFAKTCFVIIMECSGILGSICEAKVSDKDTLSVNGQ